MTSLPQRRNAPPHGFTLIELLIVIAITAILSSIAAPSFYNMIRNMALTGAATELVSGLQFARAEALRSNSMLLFTLDRNRTWRVIRDANGNGSHDPGEEVLRESSLSDNIDPVEPGKPVPAVIFTASGIARFNPPEGTGGNCRNGDVCICLKATGYPPQRMIRVRKLGRPVILGGKSGEQNSAGSNVMLVCAA
ncbi:MAG: GspH/FimT family pseudopilin [Azoarcus sp.]|nr:GspH/FimT family pseudopilin [Azoarcus sp.]